MGRAASEAPRDSKGAPTRGRRAPGLGAAVLAAALAALPAAGAEAEAARRIVSMNLCADQLVLSLADRGRIASVSAFAADPAVSAMAGEARGIPVNHGRAEEILPLDPDLVLSGVFNDRATVALLSRLGVRVVELEVPAGFDEVRAQIRAVAEAIGEPARGERLVARFDARLRAAAAQGEALRPAAVFYSANGITSGSGTLMNDVIEAAGYDNLAARLGLAGTARLSLEALLVSGPDLVVLDGRDAGPRALAQEVLRHPAFRHLLRRTPSVVLPARLWICGGPPLAEAVERLAAARRAGAGPLEARR